MGGSFVSERKEVFEEDLGLSGLLVEWDFFALIAAGYGLDGLHLGLALAALAAAVDLLG